MRGTKMGMEKTSEKLSSGFRINKSADDAAGLAISETLTAAIRGTQQATRNAQDGISFVQIAEGGMNEVGNILVRMRELGVQAASDTIGDRERGYLNKETQQLKLEVERVAQATEFNGTKLLNGSGGVLDFQIGTHNNGFEDRITYDASLTNITLSSLGMDAVTADNKASAQDSLAKVDEAIQLLNGNRATLGALQSRMNSTISNNEVATENYSAARSRIKDADIANESAEIARYGVMAQAGISVLAQANQSQAMVLKLLG